MIIFQGIDIGIPPCVPPELGNMRFWDALNGRAWLNNATKFGHGDLLCDLCDSAVEVSKLNFVFSPLRIGNFQCFFSLLIFVLLIMMKNWKSHTKFTILVKCYPL